MVNKQHGLKFSGFLCGLALVLTFGSEFSVLGASSELRFGGPEIFPIDPRIGQLHSADFNGDGKLDLLVVNSRRSRIQILFNQSGEDSTETRDTAGSRDDINQLPPDSRFTIESISTEEQVTSLVVADVVGDGLPDIIYCGNRNELILLENKAEQWIEVGRWSVLDTLPGGESLQLGDLDGDGEAELIVLAETALYLTPTANRMTDVRPERVAHGGGYGSFLVAELTGDGLDDLLLLPKSGGKFGYLRSGHRAGLSASERLVELGENRFLGLVGKDDNGLVSIAQRTGRASFGELKHETVSEEGDEISTGSLSRILLPEGQTGNGRSTWIDLNGDGLHELIVADGEAGRVLVHFQREPGEFELPRGFGSYLGIDQLVGADWGRDGNSELFLLSQKENQVGMTRWEEGKGLPFPKSIRVSGKPLALAYGSLSGGVGERLVVLARGESGSRVVLVGEDLKTVEIPVELSPSSDRVHLVMHDVNQDGHQDIVVLAPYEEIWVLMNKADSTAFEPFRLSSAARDMERPWVGRADFDGDGKPELVVPQKNAVRGIVVDATEGAGPVWQIEVKEQINAGRSDSVVGGIVELRPGPEQIVGLLDIRHNEVACLEKSSDGRWLNAATVKLPPGDYLSMSDQLLELGSLAALSISSASQSLIQMLSGERWVFGVDGTYETESRGARLGQCLSGDFSGDGEPEYVFLETADHHIEVVGRKPGDRLRLLYRWPVFESRTFRSRRTELPEPREALIRDVTGDGRPDLIVVVHDRVLLYPQL